MGLQHGRLELFLLLVNFQDVWSLLTRCENSQVSVTALNYKLHKAKMLRRKYNVTRTVHFIVAILKKKITTK